jgi:hypothetical protein
VGRISFELKRCLLSILLEQMPNDLIGHDIGMQAHRDRLSTKTANSSITPRIRSRTRTTMTGQWQVCRRSAREEVGRVQYGMTTLCLPVQPTLAEGLVV